MKNNRHLLLGVSAFALTHHVSAFDLAPPRKLAAITSSRRGTNLFVKADDYTPLEGEKKINLRIDLESSKVATQDTVCQGDKHVYCRCWHSKTFPLCDGTHMKHNKATGDNVGPLIVSVPKADGSKQEQAKRDKVAGRKKRVILGYKAIVVSYLALAAFVITKEGPSLFSFFYAAGNVSLPAGVAYIMISAAKNDRLKSDTYKRLNLALLGYGLVGLSTIATVTEKQKFPFLFLPFFFAIVNTVKAYTYGVLGWDKQRSEKILVQDFVAGTKDTIKGLFSIPKNIKSFGYLAATLSVGTMTMSQMVEIFRLLLQGSTDLMAPLVSRVGRLALLTAVLYTLKDAADRDRLEGTTFIQLNYLSALVMAANCIFLGSLGSIVGGAAGFFAAFFAFNGVSSYFKRNYV